MCGYRVWRVGAWNGVRGAADVVYTKGPTREERSRVRSVVYEGLSLRRGHLLRR